LVAAALVAAGLVAAAILPAVTPSAASAPPSEITHSYKGTLVAVSHVTDGRCYWEVGALFAAYSPPPGYVLQLYSFSANGHGIASSTPGGSPLPGGATIPHGDIFDSFTGGGGPAPCAIDPHQGGRFPFTVVDVTAYAAYEPSAATTTTQHQETGYYTVTLGAKIPQGEMVDPSVKAPYNTSSDPDSDGYNPENGQTSTLATLEHSRLIDSVPFLGKDLTYPILYLSGRYLGLVPELCESDLSLVEEIVDGVATLQGRDEFLAAMLAGIVRAVPCSIATVNEVDPSADRVRFWAEPTSFRPPGDMPELLDFADEHPVISYMARTGDGSVRAISDFWTTEQYHESRLYREIYGRLGVEHQIAFSLPAPLPVVLGIALNRGQGSGFSARDRTILATLRPSLSLAWRNARDQERLVGLLGAASAAAGEFGWGVVVLCDPPEELTPGTFETIAQAFGRPSLADPHDILATTVTRWVAEQRRADGDPRGPELRRALSADTDDARIVLHYLAPGERHPGALVVRQEQRSALGQRYESLGLTMREAEIVRLVTLGETYAAIARRLAIAPATVKKHLNNVYTKLGVRSRAALTALVLELSGD